MMNKKKTTTIYRDYQCASVRGHVYQTKAYSRLMAIRDLRSMADLASDPLDESTFRICVDGRTRDVKSDKNAYSFVLSAQARNMLLELSQRRQVSMSAVVEELIVARYHEVHD